MKKSAATANASASETISKRIADLGDWRGDALARMRALIHEADPQIVETYKWVKSNGLGTPVFEHDGIVCTGESYKEVVKLTFAQGAALADPKKLFNASLDGGTRRAIDIREGDKIDAAAFKKLIRDAVALNTEGKGAKKAPAKRAAAKKATAKKAATKKK